MGSSIKRHAGVKVISRDRYGKYIQGATKGALQAIQVADLWHLLKQCKANCDQDYESRIFNIESVIQTRKS